MYHGGLSFMTYDNPRALFFFLGGTLDTSGGLGSASDA